LIITDVQSVINQSIFFRHESNHNMTKYNGKLEAAG